MPKTLFLYIIITISPLSLLGQKSGTINVTQPDIPARRITASIGGESGGSVHKNVLLGSEIIEVNDTTKVIMYEFNMTCASVKSHLTVQGNKLEAEVKRYIEGLGQGQIIRFKNILCQDKNGLMFRVYDLQFEIDNGK